MTLQREVSFFIDRKKELINANVKRHHHDHANRARRLRAKANEETERFEKPLFNKFSIQVYIYPPTKRRLDPPNLYPTVKHLIDGMTDNNWWIDDDWDHMRSMSFLYGGISERPGAKGDFQVKIVITEEANEL